MTGEFLEKTFACRMNRRGLVPGNHLLSKKVSAVAAMPPETGSKAPQTVVVVKRNNFAGHVSMSVGLPMVST